MKIVMLDAKTLGNDADIGLFKQFGEFEAFDTTTTEERLDHIGDAKIVLTNKVVIDKAIMDACPNLGLICVTATGTNNVDLAYAKEKGIVVKNVAGYSTASVAQATFTLALSVIGQIAYYDQYVKSGAWTKSDIFTHLDRPIVEIKGKRWGIVGLGAIGKEVGKIASAFGADVVYYSTSGANANSEYEQVSLETLMKTCHIVSIHAPLNEKTMGLIGEKELSWMKKRALLLNLGRGGIVDELALSHALDTLDIFAGLDVVSVEPMRVDSPLLHVTRKDRLVMTPHVAWASVEARTELIRLVSENIKDYLGA
jgi:lactate dehydrogenase-like 2-hydroxyacid dehydrogenase